MITIGNSNLVQNVNTVAGTRGLLVFVITDGDGSLYQHQVRAVQLQDIWEQWKTTAFFLVSLYKWTNLQNWVREGLNRIVAEYEVHWYNLLVHFCLNLGQGFSARLCCLDNPLLRELPAASTVSTCKMPVATSHSWCSKISLDYANSHLAENLQSQGESLQAGSVTISYIEKIHDLEWEVMFGNL